MGGTAPICPFCRKMCADGGVKDHVRAKHAAEYRAWINAGQPPYWDMKALDLIAESQDHKA